MRKIVAIAFIAACLAAPGTASARIGPESLSFCDIAEWLGVTWVRECEGGW